MVSKTRIYNEERWPRKFNKEGLRKRENKRISIYNLKGIAEILGTHKKRGCLENLTLTRKAVGNSE